jgi:outer membrane protein OmpA-like peptidoglycan-associated protein
MSRGDLQEMEVGTKQSKGPVTANAKPGDPMPKLTTGGTSVGYEDLGGPSPENYSPTNDSAKIKEPKIKTVKDVVNKGAKPADPMPQGLKSGDEVELEDTQEIVAETEETTEETVEEETVEIDIEADVNALLGGEELSEEFREKAKTVFEAALQSKVNQLAEDMQAKFDEKLVEEIESTKSELAERVDAYLEYVSEEWFVENELAIEHGLKTELTESFLGGMKSLFEEHYVQIPDDKYDVLESMVEKLDDMETKLNEQIEKNISLNGRLGESVASGILDQVSDGLAATQKEKLASLSESVEFESEGQYREKLETLKESYFPGNTPKATGETISETVDVSQGDVSGSMASYLKTLHAVAKK